MMTGLLSHLQSPVLTDDQRVAVNRWKYAQRLVKDSSGPLGKGFVPLELWAIWNDAMNGVSAVGLDPADYLRVKK